MVKVEYQKFDFGQEEINKILKALIQQLNSNSGWANINNIKCSCSVGKNYYNEMCMYLKNF